MATAQASTRNPVEVKKNFNSRYCPPGILGYHHFPHLRATAKPAPSLASKGPKVAVKDLRTPLAVTKCRCCASWCHACFKSKGAKRIARYMRKMQWRSVRQIRLSVNRDLYATGEEAYRDITENKRIAQFIRDLGRYGAVSVVRWLWILEWHQDGFPHWHVFVEVEEKGQAGMIGYETADRFWHRGYVRESYVKNEKHWNHLTGYWNKTGYFASEKTEKGHQVELPAWALTWVRSIRRSCRSGRGWADILEPSQENKAALAEKEVEHPERVRRPYAVIIDGCGLETRVRILNDQDKTEISWVVKMPFKDAIAELKGFAYAEGVGYTRNCTGAEVAEVWRVFSQYPVRTERGHHVSRVYA